MNEYKMFSSEEEYQKYLIKNTRNNAIKEFAKKLIEEKLAVILLKDKNDDFTEGFQSAIDYVEEKCNNLVKEMVIEVK